MMRPYPLDGTASSQLSPSEVGTCAVLAPGVLCLEGGVATQMEQVLLPGHVSCSGLVLVLVPTTA